MNKDNTYRLLVWNVYKEKKPTLSRELYKRIADTDFAMIQEYVSTLEPKLPDDVSVVTNFTFRTPRDRVSTGTAILAKQEPVDVMKKLSHRRELGFATKKSAIAASYELENTKITLVNIHALNFVHTKPYAAVMRDWLSLIPASGPVIFAGDFNTWRQKRFDFIHNELADMGFEYGHYENGKNMCLDHIWSRNVSVKTISCDVENQCSDHFPLTVHFSL